ncbi:hypothetical protein NQ318_004652 [Aromia moschata]|uniref:TATA-box binding protein n=1 Tax=Aromia moschata TaxID=1265417 RepID=A0AAV8Y4Z2_9CUCU|nr:hypothetical protein NQ318_004652 [Aromia moschata]
MDSMLPSPGFNIPSIGTPLHQPEEDQLILPNAIQQQQQQQSTSQVPPLAPMGGLTPTLGLGMGHAMSMPQTKYVTGFALPISTITPQTPQHTMMSPMVNLGGTSGAGMTPNMGPSTPSPMTPMTPPFCRSRNHSPVAPELFPGLIYRMVKPRIVLLIFVSGKVVLTGAKVRQEIYEAFDNIYPILKSFKKQ